MSEKEEIRRKLAEVDELRERVKELESTPYNQFARRVKSRQRATAFYFAGASIVAVTASTSGIWLQNTGLFIAVLFTSVTVYAFIGFLLFSDRASRRRR